LISLALSGPNIRKVIEVAALLKKCFERQCICSDLHVGTKKNLLSKDAENNAKIPGRISETNQQSESILLQ